jgi:N-acetylglucosaminyldiphosphoundecaprenol N-acetyl-beta-D-mannosaminyltransferase
MDCFDVLGVKIAATNLEQACDAIVQWIKTGQRTYVCVAPVATIVDCQRNEEYKNIINNAGMTTPDGMPLVWLGRRKGCPAIRRTYGPDLMQAFLSLSENREYRHYFYGGSLETNRKLIERLKEQYPQLKIVGSYAPPFREACEMERGEILEQIDQSQPDVLWVGLGSPKQDYWLARHRGRLKVPVMVGVGAAFDFLAGTKPQAPRWMQRSGLEWIFRLCCEPRRLWRRYLIGNSVFLYLLLKESLKSFGQNHGAKTQS